MHLAVSFVCVLTTTTLLCLPFVAQQLKSSSSLYRSFSTTLFEIVVPTLEEEVLQQTTGG
ncbi:hypothetical protein P153DRAFT_367315 [Dothidotthia symphoricarpi CBS 119687]|uniref:Uncharacterized protein n=1 Tax=Dothidotthia symphoricarpi CBS 119687 TaxID=1392245 RepID=A0A6A6ACQ6_9PLEO|nr:uncharacterized protein P153DRAFT_367315 [Dothidotthia symphoricarpi CBS 119687]KAF2129033.1 hypothetical protein P153DRAFT_367315 [Dothidotthia symphoricarpi CBS 119687]